MERYLPPINATKAGGIATEIFSTVCRGALITPITIESTNTLSVPFGINLDHVSG